MKKSVSSLDIPLLLDPRSPVPLYLQLRDQIIAAVAARRFAPGMKLPSTRELARVLGVSRIVTVAAYEELAARGYVESRQGSGTRVADVPGFAPGGAPKPWLPNPPQPWRISFEPGYPDAAAMNPASWKKIWRHMAADPVGNRGDAQGDPALRDSLSDYVRRTRGFFARAGDIVVTSGAFQALDLAALACGPARRVGVENPGYVRARQVFADRGLTPVPLPVGPQGLKVGRFGGREISLLYVTPSHQYPLGGTMPVAARLKLLDWARRHDAYIIEDDFDSEFRYDVAPVPALKSLDADDRVIYVGTFSKIVDAGLRLGYMIPPARLLPEILALKRRGYDSAPWPVQRALHHMIRLGELEKHVRRMRLLYARRRRVLQETLGGLPPGFDIAGDRAGLHCVLLCPSAFIVKRVIGHCGGEGVRVFSLEDYYLGRPARHGLVLGYGHLDEAAIREGAAVLKEACLRTVRKFPEKYTGFS